MVINSTSRVIYTYPLFLNISMPKSISELAIPTGGIQDEHSKNIPGV